MESIYPDTRINLFVKYNPFILYVFEELLGGIMVKIAHRQNPIMKLEMEIR